MSMSKKVNFIYSNTRLPFGEWGVPRGLTQAGTPQEKIPIALQLSVGVSYLATKKSGVMTRNNYSPKVANHLIYCFAVTTTSPPGIKQLKGRREPEKAAPGRQIVV